MFDFQEDRAAAFTRALREATRNVVAKRHRSAIASSGLANEAILRNLTGESRDKTYDAFLFVSDVEGRRNPAVDVSHSEEHANLKARTSRW